jgi:hypothetical protein
MKQHKDTSQGRDIFAIETGKAGEVISTAGPLLIKDPDEVPPGEIVF